MKGLIRDQEGHSLWQRVAVVGAGREQDQGSRAAWACFRVWIDGEITSEQQSLQISSAETIK